jgi:predicted transcriptional regulator
VLKGKYTQLIIDIVYSKQCVKKSVLVDEIAKAIGEPKDIVDRNVDEILTRLVRRGVLKRPYKGIYCKP